MSFQPEELAENGEPVFEMTGAKKQRESASERFRFWVRCFGSLFFMFALGVVSPSAAQDRESFSVLYLSRVGDPFYEPRPRYTGVSLREPRPPVEGARTAMRESRILGRALGLKFALEERELGEGETVEAVLSEASNRAVLLDLPLNELQAAVTAVGERDDLLLFNIRHADDRLRRELCAPMLLHTLPSRAMLSDALAQFLMARRWRDVLVLRGALDEDAAFVAAFERSAQKFGLEIVAVEQFADSYDPRKRDETNVALLTGDVDHDVIFLADAVGEFGRYVPYSTYAPRPVIGAEGLRAAAWHWTWERHGAPQLNQRFKRRAERDMTDLDFAAWAAVRAVVEATAHAKSTEIAALRRYLRSDDARLDVYKGAPGSFRAWNGQLRQPILLATHNAVIDRAPFEGFLHQANNLDTLGVDRPETHCAAQ